MLERTVDQLARDLADRRRLGEPPPVLLLGAGASVESGVGAMGGIYELAGVADFAAFVFQRRMAWTPAEMDGYLDEIAPVLKPAIDGRDIVVVGHSLRDRRIRELVLGAGGEAVWYVSPAPVPAGLEADPRIRAVIGPGSSFEALFRRLGATLGSAVELTQALREAPVGAALARKAPAEASTPTAAQTVDDLMASVVGIIAPDGRPFMTGFVLAQPRIIVADGWEGNVGRLADGEVSVVSADAGRHTARVFKQVRDHPFGPLLLDCPAGLKAPGLRLNPAAALPKSRIRIGIAAGERVGLASGQVPTGLEVKVDISPIGTVDSLVRVDAAVAPGSSGAPVVDEGMSVQGFIVAGSTDADSPVSYFYPAARWARHLAALPADAKP